MAIDQIVNNAAKMLYMSGGQFNIPIVFRGPAAPAHQLAAQHSQSLEAWYAHVPGLKVVTPSTPYDAKGLLKSAIRDDDPVIFMEGETLYGSKGEVPDEEYTIPIGVADVKREGTDVTLIAWSKMVTVALKAAETLAADGISCEVVDPRTLRPLDDGADPGVGAQDEPLRHRRGGLARRRASARRSRTRCSRPPSATSTRRSTRVTGDDVPMPYAKNLEHLVMPSPARLVAAVREVLYLD